MNLYKQNKKNPLDACNISFSSIKKTIRKLDLWLLSHSVCNNKGAVAGVIKNNQVEYWYSEIAGYYLSYLSYLNSINAIEKAYINQLSLTVSRWLKQQWFKKQRVTRLYSNPTIDWRNYYLFSFDLAMVLRGLADAKSQNLSLAWDGSQIADYFINFYSKKTPLESAICIASTSNNQLSWSLTPGDFQWKTLSGMLRYSQQFEHPELTLQIDKTYKYLSETELNLEMLSAHPSLYALEGMLDSNLHLRHGLPLSKQLALIDISKKENWRTDVIAQKLRLLLSVSEATDEIDKLVQILMQSVNRLGKIGFTPYNNKVDNVWCAIFTRQALSNYIKPDLIKYTQISQYI